MRLIFVEPFELEGDSLVRVQVQGGYWDAEGKTHGYTGDWQGNVRALRAANGTLEQRTDYYPYGAPSQSDNPAVSPYKYSGKRLETRYALNLSHHGARLLLHDIASFAQPDCHGENYPGISPYLYCAADPVNLTDPSGNDVVLLFTPYSTHAAILVQDENGKWDYFSFNGTYYFKVTKGRIGGSDHHNLGEKSFNSPKEFFDSYFNSEGTYESTIADKTSGYRFKPEDAEYLRTNRLQDEVIRTRFNVEAYIPYEVLTHNCAQVVTRCLENAGILPILPNLRYPWTLHSFIKYPFLKNTFSY